jgi:hypothetical protein
MASFIGFCPGNFDMILQSVLLFARQLLSGIVQPGDIAVDATVGQGNDTLFLAELVGPQGQVFGFDVQTEAIIAARKKVTAALASDETIHWVHRSHEFMLEEIPLKWHGGVRAIMFNLGYLPGFDHEIKTSADSTIQALNASLNLLHIGGLITIVAYTGHEGALTEADAVVQWSALLPQKLFHVLHYQFLNQINHPPFLMVIEKNNVQPY